MVNSLYNPRYTSLEEVKLALANKVSFRNEDPQSCSDNEVLDYIQKGESIIQLKLSRQYMIPFMGVNSQKQIVPFDDIEFIETIQYISELCLLQTCVLLMQTLFGRDEGVRGTTYLKMFKDQLKEQLEYAIGLDPDTKEYLYPPMLGLATNNKASYFRSGIQSPLTCRVGAKSGSLGNQVRGRLPLPAANWNFWATINGQQNYNGGS